MPPGALGSWRLTMTPVPSPFSVAIAYVDHAIFSDVVSFGSSGFPIVCHAGNATRNTSAIFEIVPFAAVFISQQCGTHRRIASHSLLNAIQILRRRDRSIGDSLVWAAINDWMTKFAQFLARFVERTIQSVCSLASERRIYESERCDDERCAEL